MSQTYDGIAAAKGGSHPQRIGEIRLAAFDAGIEAEQAGRITAEGHHSMTRCERPGCQEWTALATGPNYRDPHAS